MSEYEGGICCAAALQAEGSAGWEQAQINRIADLEAELTRLRAALASIAALQTEEPTHEDGLHGLGLWQAAEMARAALVTT